MNSFFAMMSRMKYIDRWALMRNSRRENLSEHSLEVSMIAHALAVIGNTYLGKDLDAEKTALLALYHDSTEIITGDMPTPVKYDNAQLKTSYKDMEQKAAQKLLSMLPEKMQPAYRDIFEKNEDDAYLWKLVKAADKLSAYIKCIEEEQAGNREFASAAQSTLSHIEKLGLPEAEIFMDTFMDAYGRNLDELTGGC